jgi:endonuclease G
VFLCVWVFAGCDHDLVSAASDQRLGSPEAIEAVSPIEESREDEVHHFQLQFNTRAGGLISAVAPQENPLGTSESTENGTATGPQSGGNDDGAADESPVDEGPTSPEEGLLPPTDVETSDSDEVDTHSAIDDDAEDETEDYAPRCGDHDRHGVPATSDALLCRVDYLVGYNATRKAADWVAYHVTAEGAEQDIERTDDFRADDEIDADAQAQLNDYKYSGYDRGHMFPAALATTDASMSESFLLSNITPQLPGFNRKGWKDLESWVRHCASEVGELDVVTGVIYDEDVTDIGDGVQIADMYYKIVHHNGAVQAFLVIHAPADMDNVSHWEISEEELEALTGVDFFAAKTTVDGVICQVN